MVTLRSEPSISGVVGNGKDGRIVAVAVCPTGFMARILLSVPIDWSAGDACEHPQTAAKSHSPVRPAD